MMITRNFIGVVVLCLCALAACTSSKESKKTLTVLHGMYGMAVIQKLIPEKGVRELLIF